MTPAHLIVADHPVLSFDSVLVLLTLMTLLALAAGMLWALLWRETGNRRRAEVQDWARASGFRHRHGFGTGPRVPPPLDRFAGARVVEHYEGKRCAVVQFLVAAAPPTVGPEGAPADPLPPPATRRRNVLLWPIEAAWPAAAGLRPASAGDSLIDLLALPPQETGTATARFVAHAAERRLATALATSSLRGLLPPDVGLLLAGRHLVLEFSDRPFDAIEFNRMIAVAGQVVAHLPGQE